jgi:hypothetical protein
MQILISQLEKISPRITGMDANNQNNDGPAFRARAGQARMNAGGQNFALSALECGDLAPLSNEFSRI